MPVPDARRTVRRRAPPRRPVARRAFLEAELVELLPDGAELTYAATSEARFPISIAYTEQSDVEGAEAALRAELDGGAVTGLEPLDDDGTLTVSFWVSTLQATLPTG